LISSNSLFSFFYLFALLVQVPTTSSLIARRESITALLDDVKAKLTEVLPLLNRDLGQLVQDDEPIRAIFKQIQGKLPKDLKAKML
jgi:hypothetical protein